METDERHLDRNVIDLTGNKDVERTEVRTHGSDQGVVQEGGDVVPPPQESMDNSPSLFDYRLDNLYNDLIDDFDPYLEYGKGYQNRTAFEDAFYKYWRSHSADVWRNPHYDSRRLTMTHNDSQSHSWTLHQLDLRQWA